MKTVKQKVFYFEQNKKPDLHLLSVPSETFIKKVIHIQRIFYDFLYVAVGKKWNWVNRFLLSIIERTEIIHNPGIEIYVLWHKGQPAGFTELDIRNPKHIELVHFGLMPEFIGKGLGKYFLFSILKIAWRKNPDNIWLHTCDFDHPAAIKLYQKAGFLQIKETIEDQIIPEEHEKDEFYQIIF